MPRGVYDRSKLKKAKTESKAAEAPKAKRKYTRRAVGPAPVLGGVAQAAPTDILFQLRELASLRAAGITQVDGLIKKMVSKLETAWDEANAPAEKAAVEVKTEKKNGKTEEKVQTALPAPVPFIPQTPASPA